MTTREEGKAEAEARTPTTDEIRESSDRWHQAELRRAKVEAWREGHDAGWTAHYNGDDLSVYRNPYRADRIEEDDDE